MLEKIIDDADEKMTPSAIPIFSVPYLDAITSPFVVSSSVCLSSWSKSSSSTLLILMEWSTSPLVLLKVLSVDTKCCDGNEDGESFPTWAHGLDLHPTTALAPSLGLTLSSSLLSLCKPPTTVTVSLVNDDGDWILFYFQGVMERSTRLSSHCSWS